MSQRAAAAFTILAPVISSFFNFDLGAAAGLCCAKPNRRIPARATGGLLLSTVAVVFLCIHSIEEGGGAGYGFDFSLATARQKIDPLVCIHRHGVK